MSQSPFPVTPELIDSLSGPDATWPNDPAVPVLPPLPDTDDPPVPKDNFLAAHFWEGMHKRFGGDRFDQFFWRLQQSGLTKRQEARPPFTTQPLRWPGDTY